MRIDGKTVFLRLLFSALSVGVMAVIYFFSSQSGEVSAAVSDRVAGVAGDVLSFPFLEPFAQSFLSSIREFAHVFLYFCLGTSFSLLAFTFSFRKKRAYFLFPSAGAFVYACLDELHQYFVPGRVAAAEDVLLDSVGILSATAICCLLFFLVQRKKQGGMSGK